MGTTNEEIIYSITLNVDKTTDAMIKYTKAALDAKAATKGLGTTADEAEAASARQEKAAKKTKETLDVEVGSINALREANKQLTKERNNVNTSTEAGQTKLKSLNAQLDANNKVIKENVDAYTKQKIGVGGYSDALGQFFPKISSAISGVKGLNTSMLTLAANPVGLVIAAIALALAAVFTYFTRTEEGGDKLAKVMAQLGAVLDVVLDRVAMLGGALVKLFSGDVIGAASDAQAAFSGVADEIEREVKAAGELADILDELEDREINNSVAISETTNQIKQLIIASKNRALTEQQKIELQQKAKDLEISSNETSKKILLDKLKATADEIQMKNDKRESTIREGETEIQYAKRLMANTAIMADQRKKVADALIAYNNVQGESLNIQEKINNQIDANIDKQQAKAKADAEAAQKRLDWIDKENAAIQQSGVAYQLYLDGKAATERTAEEQRDADRDERFKKRLAKDTAEKKKIASADYQQGKAGLTADQVIANQRLGVANVLYRGLSSSLSAFGIKSRGINSGLAIANTFLGVTEILKAPTAPFVEPFASIVRAINIGATIATGLGAVARINGVAFAKGGRTGISGTKITGSMGTPINMPNGDNLLATVRTGELILNEGQQNYLGLTPDRLRMAGVNGFAGGGVVGQSETRQALSAQPADAAEQIVNELRNQKIVLVYQDFEAAKAKNDGPVNQARVVS